MSADELIDRLYPGFARRLARLRRDLLQLARTTPLYAYFEAARRLVAEREPVIAAVLADRLLLAYLTAARSVARQTPGLARQDVPALVPPQFPSPAPERPTQRLALTEAAADWLASRRLVDRPTLSRLEADAASTALVVTRDVGDAALGAIHGALVEDVREGGTLQTFRKRAGEALAGLTSGETETLYRTTVGFSYRAGQQEMLDHPDVAPAFPYGEWFATNDTRVRPDHWAMQTAGLDGTGVYRLDDPLLRRAWPPASWNCRCQIVHMSVADAAARGVSEAREWLRTGRPPSGPAWVRWLPILIPPGWPTSGIQAA